MGSEDRKGDKKTEERKKPSSTSKSVPSGSSSKHAPQLTLTDRTKPPADNKGPTSLSKNPPQSSSAKVSNTQQPSVKVSNTPQPSASDKGKGIAQPPASGSNSAGSASNTSFRDLRADAKRMVDLGRRSSSNPAKLSREKLQIFVEHSGILMIQGSPDRKNFIMITQDDDRFLLAALCIELALKLLESKIGRRALIENGQEIIRRRESMKKSSDPGVKANGSHAYPTPQKLDTMGTWVDSWLAKLRNDFPKLYLSYTLLPHTSGSTSKSTRVQNMQDYNPKAAADLLLQATDFDQLTLFLHATELFKTREDPPSKGKAVVAYRNYYRGIAKVSAVLAHELAHLFTGYLTGTRRPSTPEGIGLPPVGPPQPGKGESGFAWDLKVFDGYHRFMEDPNDMFRENQAGIPYLLRRHKGTFLNYVISDSFIYSIAQGDMSALERSSIDSTHQPVTDAELYYSIPRDMVSIRISKKKAEFAKNGVPWPLNLGY